jgi:prepilin-type N-terminal cleavage/methylation domain-containing protein
MRIKSEQSGLTLTEMVVVIAAMTILVAFGLPAVRALLHSFESQSGTKSMISATLATARAIAAKEQHYAGIRFQRDLDGNQYMVFIIHDFDKTGLSSGFRVVEGVKPIKLPEDSGVTDLIVRVNHGDSATAAEDISDEPIIADYLDDRNPLNLGPDGKNRNITDISAFSVIFSPAGRLVMREVRIRNRQGIYQPDNGILNKVSRDDVFNSLVNIQSYKMGMFVQDDYADYGLGAETSRSCFVIYDKMRFDELDAQDKFEYLNKQEVIYINPYMGTMISNP